MTLTIDLSPMEQARLTAAAQQSGLDPSALAKRLVTEHLPLLEIESRPNAPVGGTMPEEARIAAIRASRGSMAHVAGVSVEDLHRERQTDKKKKRCSLRDKARDPYFGRWPYDGPSEGRTGKSYCHADFD